MPRPGHERGPRAGVRRPPAVDRPRAAPLPAGAGGLCPHGGEARLPLPVRQRPSGLRPALARRPDHYRQARDRLAGELARAGRAAEPFPAAIATTWLYVTEDRAEAERVLGDVLAPMLGRPAEELRSAPLLVGPAGLCAERLAAWAAAGARCIFVWPLGDELAQLERFRERVVGAGTA